MFNQKYIPWIVRLDCKIRIGIVIRPLKKDSVFPYLICLLLEANIVD